LKQLIVNADDFGFTRDVNSGIIEAHRRGILTATTLMANGAAFDDAVRLARNTPALDIGCHLVLVGGNSLVDGRPFPLSVAEMLRAVTTRRLRPYEELRAQILKIVDAGISPTHLDTHKHTHLFPPVLDAVARLAEEFGVRWVRRPFDLPITPNGTPSGVRLVSRSLQIIRRRFHRVLEAHGCRTTDHFAGFQMTGRLDAACVITLLRSLPPGVTEFMTHPGHHTAELENVSTRLKASRALELAALTSAEVRETLTECGIELTRYSELPTAP
jgi:chitin disaccharide deacetylase